MAKNNQLKIGAVLSYVSIFINIAAGLIYTPWMVQKIGQSDYGLYTLANSLITLFLVDFGLSSATSRYVSKYRAENNQEKINNFLGAIYKLYFMITAVIFVALLIIYFFIDEIYVQLTLVEIKRFKVVYIISALFAVINFPLITFNGILTSYEKFVHLKFADILYRISFVGSTLIALVLGYGLYSLVALHALAGLLTIVYKYLIIKTRLPIKINFKYTNGKMYKDIFEFSFWVTVATLAHSLIFNIIPSILGAFASAVAIAIFGVVKIIEDYSSLITNAVNGLFIPRIAKIYTEEDSAKQLSILLLKVGKIQYLINGIMVAGFAVVGKEFIDLWMGNEYSVVYYGVLLVMIPGLFFNSLQIANTALIIDKKVKYQAIIYIVIGILNVVLAILLAPKYGAVGACGSIFIAYCIKAILLNILYYKLLHLDIIDFVKKCYVKLSIPIVISVCFGLVVNRLFIATSWVDIIIKSLFVLIVYVVFVLLIEKGYRRKVVEIIRRR